MMNKVISSIALVLGTFSAASAIPAPAGSSAETHRAKMIGGPSTVAPKYLSVPNFRDCMGTIDHDGWSGWCMLKKRPDNCSRLSWNALHELGVKDKPQVCDSESELPTTPREENESK